MRLTRIVCADGSYLNDDNECEKRRAKRDRNSLFDVLVAGRRASRLAS